MILPFPSLSKFRKASGNHVNGEDVEQLVLTTDSPPGYEEIQAFQETALSLPSATPTPVAEAPTILHPTYAVNNISIKQTFGSIDCKYTIDPLLNFPTTASWGVRSPNIRLETKSGTIHADLTLLYQYPPREGEEETRKITKVVGDISSTLGGISVTLRRPIQAQPTLRLFAVTRTGTISVSVPRNFHGFIDATTKLGRLTLEPSLEASSSILTSGMGFKRVFVGDTSALEKLNWRSDEEDGQWQGDELILRTSVGDVGVGYGL